jgi:hypothetical protein
LCRKALNIDAPGRGADLDNVFIAANYHLEKNPLNPDNALVRCVVDSARAARWR